MIGLYKWPWILPNHCCILWHQYIYIIFLFLHAYIEIMIDRQINRLVLLFIFTQFIYILKKIENIWRSKNNNKSGILHCLIKLQLFSNDPYIAALANALADRCMLQQNTKKQYVTTYPLCPSFWKRYHSDHIRDSHTCTILNQKRNFTFEV